MDEPKQISPDVFEGTWEELLKVASNFNGHRLRLQILPEAQPSPLIKPKVQGALLRQMFEEMNNMPPATPEEIQAAEDELLEFKRNMNENRRRDGAEILYLDV